VTIIHTSSEERNKKKEVGARYNANKKDTETEAKQEKFLPLQQYTYISAIK
jgi:hypothetical protein